MDVEMMYVRHEFFWFKVLPFGILAKIASTTSIILVCPEPEASPFSLLRDWILSKVAPLSYNMLF